MGRVALACLLFFPGCISADTKALIKMVREADIKRSTDTVEKLVQELHRLNFHLHRLYPVLRAMTRTDK